MQLKASTKSMASLNDDDDTGSRSGAINSNHNNNNNNNNINSNDDDNSSNNNASTGGGSVDTEELKLKKQTLELRKQELEMLLSEKSWLLQQMQKQEAQILNGNCECLSLDDLLANLARQYKQEQTLRSGGGESSGRGIGTGILRRKPSSKENQLNNNNNNNNNRQSEISNRSSEYDNYPAASSGSVAGTLADNVSMRTVESAGGVLGSAGATQLQAQNSIKKRATATPTPISNLNYIQLQHKQQQQQQQQHHQMVQQHVEQQLLQQHLQYVAQQQQQQQPHLILPQSHYHRQQQQQQHQLLSTATHQSPNQQSMQHAQQQQQTQRHIFSTPQQQQPHPQQTDTISLYSVNSANVATLRQQHVAPQQQPIIVQCDKYYLSPTHQSYTDGGFIKSSQNIKRYVSPMASPTTSNTHTTLTTYTTHTTHSTPSMPQHGAQQQQQSHMFQQQQQQQHIVQLQQLQPLVLQQHSHHTHLHAHSHHQSPHLTSQRHLDAISLAPSYVSVDVETAASLGAAPPNLRWRSQSQIGSPHSPAHSADAKSHSSDMLAHMPIAQQQLQQQKNHHLPTSTISSSNTMNFYPHPPPNLKPKPLDEISISSLNSETQKKSIKPKQWLESSLDGPVIRSQAAPETHMLDVMSITAATNSTSSARLPHKHGSVHAQRERSKLSSQSMSSGRHYSLSASSQKNSVLGVNKLLQDDEGRRYAKQLSQSTSQLHAMEHNSNNVAAGMTAPSPPSISPAYYLDITPTEINHFKYLPPKLHTLSGGAGQALPTPPPRPPPVSEKSMALSTATVAGISPDIRIESPKNMTIVQQATFQPYKEVTKPFEMSDFYKYSTKFRQKEAATNITTALDAPTN